MSSANTTETKHTKLPDKFSHPAMIKPGSYYKYYTVSVMNNKSEVTYFLQTKVRKVAIEFAQYHLHAYAVVVYKGKNILWQKYEGGRIEKRKLEKLDSINEVNRHKLSAEEHFEKYTTASVHVVNHDRSERHKNFNCESDAVDFINTLDMKTLKCCREVKMTLHITPYRSKIANRIIYKTVFYFNINQLPDGTPLRKAKTQYVNQSNISDWGKEIQFTESMEDPFL